MNHKGKYTPPIHTHIYNVCPHNIPSYFHTPLDIHIHTYQHLQCLHPHGHTHNGTHLHLQIHVYTSHFKSILLLSRFSRVRLCRTPKTAAHQAAPSLGFSRQEHWSGLPFPSPSKVYGPIYISTHPYVHDTHCKLIE